MSQKNHVTLASILAALPALAPSELRQVLEAATGLLAGPDPAAADAPAGEQPAKKAKGRQHSEEWTEWKMIRGRGPYEYKRQWKNGKLTSTYVPKGKGKGKAEES